MTQARLRLCQLPYKLVGSLDVFISRCVARHELSCFDAEHPTLVREVEVAFVSEQHHMYICWNGHQHLRLIIDVEIDSQGDDGFPLWASKTGRRAPDDRTECHDPPSLEWLWAISTVSDNTTSPGQECVQVEKNSGASVMTPSRSSPSFRRVSSRTFLFLPRRF